MGRDVTGLRVASVKAKPTGVSRTSTEKSGGKAALVKQGAVKVSPNENSNGNDVLGVKIPNLEDAKNDVKSSDVEEPKSNSPEKVDIGMISVENLTGDQHGCASPIQAETPGLCRNTSPKINVLPSPSSSKKSQSNTPCISRKLLDEDNWSTGSSTTASVKGARFKTTVPIAPKFSVTQRLEKRKEYYTKLEEKHKALEEEKLEYEERNKEEEQAAIKQLRKSMTYKANPVPNFYYDGPPPKKELKKLPTTRAISPNIGRRKSFGDAASSSAEKKAVCARSTRYSVGTYTQNHKQGSVTPKKNGNKSNLKKESPKQQAKESEKDRVAAPENISEQTNTNISSYPKLGVLS